MSENNEVKHVRRVRYKGTHPKKFSEKYKEQNPEKYADTIEKVISKGSTPAGMHISIMVQEILDFLQIQPGQKGLDATLGYGGHTTEMLKCLKGEGHMYALDVDPIEIVKTKERLASRGFGPEILKIKQINFANLPRVLHTNRFYHYSYLAIYLRGILPYDLQHLFAIQEQPNTYHQA